MRWIPAVSLGIGLALSALSGASAEPAAASRYCTKSACLGAASTPWDEAAGFGAAALAAVLIARRRRPAPR